MRAWRLGRDISGDEQMIGFRGRHVDKLRITYKVEGDGFQCDAILTQVTPGHYTFARIVLAMASSGTMVTTYSGMAQLKREVKRE